MIKLKITKRDVLAVQGVCEVVLEDVIAKTNYPFNLKEEHAEYLIALVNKDNEEWADKHFRT